MSKTENSNVRKISDIKSQFFKKINKINKINKPLARPRKIKKQIINIRKEGRPLKKLLALRG